MELLPKNNLRHLLKLQLLMQKLPLERLLQMPPKPRLLQLRPARRLPLLLESPLQLRLLPARKTKNQQLKLLKQSLTPLLEQSDQSDY